MRRVRLGRLHVDSVTAAGALEIIATIIRNRRGGYVVTPNVDHVVLAEVRPDLRQAYAHASLSLADGMPLVWLARLLGKALPEKVSGSDLVAPLAARAAAEGWRLYLLGGEAGVGELAAAHLKRMLPKLTIVGIDSPPLGFHEDLALERQTLNKVRATRPHIVLMALGCPKQELLMWRWRRAVAPAVMVGVGATLDFLAGRARRAPHWLSNLGLEWAYRLAHDPRRLASRYLARDLKMLPIAIRMLLHARAARVARN